MSTPPDLRSLNDASPAAFAAAVGPLFEHAPRFLGRLAAARPFATWGDLFEVGRGIAHAMPEAEQIELVDAHPRLGAAAATVSAHSLREQGHRPSTPRPPDDPVAAELARLNDAYEARFGFRYCVFVAGRSLASLLPDMLTALAADRAAELHRALDAVVDIAVPRLAVLGEGAS
ncbi:MAG: 2-oxo-4-hydroxy-4-carboxy-5-ureidoimidazoline decarboxylase [Chloroflexi bacterium]|nr:2-oxo-4-hydroxy-4-carboxy-5-ureidoimidazoline decarboxylase [Chloroflexota bacterium]